MREAIFLVVIAVLTGCTVITKIDREAEGAVVATRLGIPRNEIELTSRCRYIMVLKGVASGSIIEGVCSIAQGGLHLRSIDATTGKTSHSRTLGRSDIESISLYSSSIQPQLQVRTTEIVVGIYMVNDDGLGTVSEMTQRAHAILREAGINDEPSIARVDISTADSPLVIPVFIPRR